ncbi:MAG TPA: DNA mismatch repair endonuclease MutL [Geobacteraceae bacterium]|nr:DNA mismatch repair endonuclease MutL [Geobacteraceae bacterium]
MSTRIRILPEILTNKIAAGEVVERPASVVKELVENSLDAGCSEVIVEIESGGRRLIKVADNGSGMSREDALLSLERHATSKIANDSDLFRLSTLGFRGEALPSIASVSRFTLETREKGCVEGTGIYAEGGSIKEVKVSGVPDGTVISVRNIFFNTPARLKFMKSAETEAGHIGDLMTRLAISRPDVSIVYLNDGKTVFRVAGSDLKVRLASLLGRSLAADLYPVSLDAGFGSITGFVAKPDCSRSSTSHFFTYINGRFVRDRVVQHAVMQAYRSLLERGRYPVVALFIQVPAGEVDVNVHPTKHEVRFREQGRMHDAIVSAVGNALRESPWLRRTIDSGHNSHGTKKLSVSERKIEEVRDLLENYKTSPLPSGSFARDAHLEASRASGEVTRRTMPEEADKGYFSSLSVIGQYNARYIICQDDADLVIIDQHAAHERIAFERLKKEFNSGSVESQAIMFPETMDLSFRETAAMRENRHGIKQLGFGVEEFGGNSWVLNAVPGILEKADCGRILHDILEELQNLGRSSSFADAIEGILARMACHSVIRGEQRLTLQEIDALFRRMDDGDFSGNCPHGRPVLAKLAASSIEKMFKRG